jgi:hypothetical protein
MAIIVAVNNSLVAPESTLQFRGSRIKITQWGDAEGDDLHMLVHQTCCRHKGSRLGGRAFIILSIGIANLFADKMTGSCRRDEGMALTDGPMKASKIEARLRTRTYQISVGRLLSGHVSKNKGQHRLVLIFLLRAATSIALGDSLACSAVSESKRQRVRATSRWGRRVSSENGRLVKEGQMRSNVRPRASFAIERGGAGILAI